MKMVAPFHKLWSLFFGGGTFVSNEEGEIRLTVPFGREGEQVKLRQQELSLPFKWFN
jgi:hypothetical protein